MKKTLVFCLLSVFGASAFGVSMNFNGSVRTEASHYSKLNLGLTTSEPTKSFISARALLNPNVIIDDHFSLKSQWSLLTSPNFTPATTLGTAGPGFGTPGLGPTQGQGGFIFGDPNAQALVLSRVWLEWTSDFGVMRLGRMPVSWGYGLLYDAGANTWDDFQSTFDRLEYRLHLGHLVGALAYSKGRKLSVLGNTNDQEFYTVYLQYDNPEQQVEGGLMYEKQARSTSQGASITSGTGNPHALPAGHGAAGAFPPLSTNMPYPSNNNVLSAYLKKSFSYFTVGGELDWLSGNAFDFNGNGPDGLNSVGLLLNATYEHHNVKLFLDFLFAGGDSNLSDDNLTGFTLIHRNRRPGLILGRELLGNYHGNSVAQGSPVVYGTAGTFSGIISLRPGIRIDWSPAWSSGLEFIWARKAAVEPGGDANLGIEIDVGTEYAVYKNFDLGLNVGFLFPGTGLGVPNPATVFALRTTAALKF
jgi:hypothetical protein